MTDLAGSLAVIARTVLEPGEALEGTCVATRQGLLSGTAVAVVVTDRRLVIQPVDRRFQPKGDPLSLPPERIATAQAGSGVESWLTAPAAIVDWAAVSLKLRTTDGERMKLMMMRGDGPLGRLGGGEAQREGAIALFSWLSHHAPAA